jgi:hypothetical protein
VSWKRESAAIGAVLLLVTLAFSDVLFSGKSFFIRDLARIYYPERAALREIVRAGSFPFWNPHYAAGQPAAANPTYEVFYPPQWFVLLPDFLLGVKIEIVFHFLLAAAGMFCLLRTLRVRIEAAAFGALVYALSGMMLSLASLLPCLFAFAWFPWLGFYAERALRRRNTPDVAAAALILGVICLIAEPASLIQACALLGAYAIYRSGRRGLKTAILIGLLALLVGAAQLFPAIDLLRDSGRRNGLAYDAVAQWSLAPARPLELVAPELFGSFSRDGVYFWASDDSSGAPWAFSWYAGLLTGALIIAGFVQRVRGWRFAAGVAVAGYALALGRHTPFFRLFYLAGMRFVRFPEKWFMPAELVLIVFGAITADRFLEDAAVRRTTFRVSIVLMIVAGGSLLFAYSPLFARVWHPAGPDVDAHARLGALHMLLTAAALVLILTLRENRRIGFALLALFVLADLLPRVSEVAPRVEDAFYGPPQITRTLPPHSRVYNDADWEILLGSGQANLNFEDRWKRVRNAVRPEMQELAGLDSVLEADVTLTNLAPSQQLLDTFLTARFRGRRELVPMLLSFAGANAVIVLRDASSPDNPASVVPLPGNVRAYFAEQLADVRRIGERHPWPRRIAFVDRPFAAAEGNVVAEHESPDSLDFDVVTQGDAALVLSVTPHKYWSATIDGKPVQPYSANIGFQALTIPPGRHHVALRYRNPLVIACAFVSLLSALALLLVALRSRAQLPPSPH